MKNLRITRSVIPNSFTALNMFCGFVSLVYSHEQRFDLASYFIIIAAVFDALDGIMARLTKSSSELGVELDSLSDLVSFGVAPSFLMYQTYLNSWGISGIILSSLPMLFGGFRLARFNVQLTGFDKAYFTGLPIPSSAMTIAAFVIIYFKNGAYISPFEVVVVPMIIILSLLMVSKVRYETLPKTSVKGIKEKPFMFLFVFTSAIAVVISKGYALFYVFVLMILFGIFKYVYISLFKAKQ